MAKLPAYAYVRAFRRNCPNVRLTQEEAVELARLFHEAKKAEAEHVERVIKEAQE